MLDNLRIWRNADHDVPVHVLDEPPQPAPDGRRYQKVSYGDSNVVSYVPADELLASEEAERTNRPGQPAPPEPANWCYLPSDGPVHNAHLLFSDEFSQFDDLFFTATTPLGVIKAKRLLAALDADQWLLRQASAHAVGNIPDGESMWLLGIRDPTIARRFAEQVGAARVDE